jgi:hypothetical protein
MTELTQANLEAILLDIGRAVDEQGEVIRIRPTTILVPRGMQKRVRKIMYPHNILKRRKGIRGRIYTLKWRRKNAGLFTVPREWM